MIYPFYNYKKPYRNYYSRNIYKNHNFQNNKFNTNLNNNLDNTLENNCEQEEKKNLRLIQKDTVDFFEILGFKLYYDDLLIIGLIILLFEEGVKDQLLLLSLILLIGD